VNVFDVFCHLRYQEAARGEESIRPCAVTLEGWIKGHYREGGGVIRAALALVLKVLSPRSAAFPNWLTTALVRAGKRVGRAGRIRGTGICGWFGGETRIVGAGGRIREGG